MLHGMTLLQRCGRSEGSRPACGRMREGRAVYPAAYPGTNGGYAADQNACDFLRLSQSRSTSIRCIRVTSGEDRTCSASIRQAAREGEIYHQGHQEGNIRVPLGAL